MVLARALQLLDVIKMGLNFRGGLGRPRLQARVVAVVGITLHQRQGFAVRCLASLDEPDAVQPGFHIWTGSRIAWFETADATPRFAAFRPQTRGL